MCIFICLCVGMSIVFTIWVNSIYHGLAMQESWAWSLDWEDHLEKEMATHSNVLAWKIPWTEEPGRLQSMGSRRVGHDWTTSLSLFTFMHWKRKWQPTPVLSPGKFHGRRSLVDYSPWVCKELDKTEQLTVSLSWVLYIGYNTVH